MTEPNNTNNILPIDKNKRNTKTTTPGLSLSSKASISNLFNYLRDNEYKNKYNIRFNLFIDQATITTDDKPMDDYDLKVIMKDIHEKWTYRATLPSIGIAVELYAHEKEYHPVKTYLESLQWDGKERLKSLFIDYCGSNLAWPYEPSKEDEELDKIIATRWFISAVARIYQPGCKADYMLILEGKQRTGKTSFFETIGKQWYTTTQTEKINDVDFIRSLHTGWIIEMPELSGFSKVDIRTLKSVITTNKDNVRPLYDKFYRNMKRQCVLAGTTNEAQYLKDATGGTRFWPVKIWKVNIDKLKQDIDQIWAEATARYKNNEQWWPTDKEMELLQKRQETRYEIDVWEDFILRYITQYPTLEKIDDKPFAPAKVFWHNRGVPLHFIATTELLKTAFDIGIGQQGGVEQKRVAAIMSKIGWIPGRGKTPESGRRVRGYEPEGRIRDKREDND
ncbi:MAG: hypothetical protein HQL60_00290 [Magnetococcales bacterium]|nr:hypothetical protein [Magnetococcales bacterium]